MKIIFYSHWVLYFTMYFVMLNPQWLNIIDLSTFYRNMIALNWLLIMLICISSLFVVYVYKSDLEKIDHVYLEGNLVSLTARAFFEIAGIFYGEFVSDKYIVCLIFISVICFYRIFEYRIKRKINRINLFE